MSFHLKNTCAIYQTKFYLANKIEHNTPIVKSSRGTYRTLEKRGWQSKGRKGIPEKQYNSQRKEKEIPNYSWFKFSKPLFYFFCMITLLKILIARFTTSFHKLLSLLTYTSCVSWLKDNTIGKFRCGQFTIYAPNWYSWPQHASSFATGTCITTTAAMKTTHQKTKSICTGSNRALKHKKDCSN